MYSDIVISRLQNCVEHIEVIDRYFKNIENAGQFISHTEGMNFDAILMRLQALGENLKRIAQKQ